MKILHLLSQCPDFTGSGIYLQNIICEAAKKGHRNFLLAGVPLGQEIYPVGTNDKNCRFVTFSGGNLPFTIPGMSDVMPYPSSRFYDLSLAEIEAYENAFSVALTKVINEWKPDIIHSHHLWLMSSIARKTAPNLPLVCNCHSTDLRQYLNCPHLRDRVKEACGKIDKILALSKIQAAEITNLLAIPAERIAIVGGGFKADLFFQREKPLPPPVHVMYAGKLSRAKGVVLLLNSLAKIPHLPIHLHLVGQGSGEEDAECRQLADKLRCPVSLHGRVSQPELAELMGKSHLFILPSFFEGLPLVLLEALASGCRVISTDLAGCKELLQGMENTFAELLPLPPLEKVDAPFPKDMPELTRKLAKAIERKTHEIQTNPANTDNRVRARIAQYTWPAIFADIEKNYHTHLFPQK